MLRIALILLILALGGCIGSGKKPIEVQFQGSPDASEMLVFLPGLGNNAKHFFKNGFHETAARGTRYSESAFLSANVHLGYYRTGALPERFEQDVLAVYPDRKRTLVGISMGGMGVAALGRLFPDEVDEVVLIAPFLGKGKLMERFRSGALEVRPEDSKKDGFLLENWAWLISDQTDVKINLLFGEEDRLSESHRLLLEQAPHICVIRIPGKHRWSTWIPLWESFQESSCP